LILNDRQQAEIERHLVELDELLAQSPEHGNSWEAATLTAVTEMMLALPASTQNEIGAAATGEAFMAALDDVPTWAVRGAIRSWYRGDCGETYDYHWRPAPAELRKVALAEMWRVKYRAMTLRKLLRAEPLVEFDEAHRAKMRERLAGLVRPISTPPVGSDGSGGAIRET
jgi:hypothetical protein